MIDKIKYPRTPHLPYSLGATSDDKKLSQAEWDKIAKKLEGSLVLSEKMDGENTTIAREFIHARSLDSKHHPSRDWLKNLWGGIRYSIPKDIRIHGENLYAQHSIYYDELPSFFMVFGISRGDNFLSVAETKDISDSLGLWCAEFSERIPTAGYNSTREMEGYVVRNKGSFLIKDFQKNVFKFVRPNHVQTDEHWMNKEIKPNKLKEVR